jgi:hypothetical protein
VRGGEEKVLKENHANVPFVGNDCKVQTHSLSAYLLLRQSLYLLHSDKSEYERGKGR